MNTKIKYLISEFIILIAISAYLISEQEIEPPPAILKIDGKEQISGIGPYCWWGFLKGRCTDMIGLPTSQEPLIARSPFTAHLTLPVRELPYELRLNVFRGGEEDEINFSGRGWRWWKVREENVFNLPLENEQDIELSLDPGLYVLNVDAWWYEKGSASYGFLVEVRANDTGTAPITSASPVNQIQPSNATTSLAITAIQPDAGTIGTKVVIIGTGFTARDNNIAFRRAPEDAPIAGYQVGYINNTLSLNSFNHFYPIAGYQVGYINNLISSDGRTIEFVIPELLGACAFPLPVTTPVTGCPAIGIPFKPGNQTYPVSVVNQNGTSNSVNFTVSR